MNGRIYADHAATTCVRPEVAERMLEVMTTAGGNASSLHAEGRRARAVLDDARERVARVLGARTSEIVFTSGGSEGDTLAIRGAALAARAAAGGGRRLVATAATEHEAVLEAVEASRADGFEPQVLATDGAGCLSANGLAAALDRAAAAGSPAAVVSVMLANNETGVLQPIAGLAAVARARGALFHCDAVQAPGRLALDVGALGVDLMTMSGHKFYGPKGTGALFVRDGVSLAPQVFGGGQESGRRAGTENVPGIAGFALALELAEAERPLEAPRLGAVRDLFESELLRLIGDVHRTGAGVPRLPNVSSVAIPGLPADVVLARLDLDGAAVSIGSACAAGSARTSHVLAALDVPAWVRSSTIRASFGRSTGEQEARRLAAMLANVASSREAAPLSGHRLERF